MANKAAAVDCPTLGYLDTMLILAAFVRARVAMLMLGPPGIGKTAMHAQVAAWLNMRLLTGLMSTYDGVDVGGFPVVGDDGKAMARIPARLFADAAASPDQILFLDELTTVPPSVQAPLLRVLLERVAGDLDLGRVALSAAANAPEHAPGGQELSAATVNRVGLVNLAPTVEEVAAYMTGSPVRLPAEAAPAWASDADREEAHAALKAEYGACLAVEPRLLQLVPPAASVRGMAPWASPRAVERGLSVLAEAQKLGLSMRLQHAALAACIGEASAAAFMGIQRMRELLPSDADVIRDPLTAKVPDEQHQIAAIGMLVRVARPAARGGDASAAWVYAARLTNQEVRVATTRVLMAKPMHAASPHAAAATKAKLRLMQEAQKIVAR